jgi:hypothetical protein
MPRFFFPVDYKGYRHEDERGEDFSTAEVAMDHAKVVAEELSRNHSKSVTVFVVAADGARVIASANANDAEADERLTRRAPRGWSSASI